MSQRLEPIGRATGSLADLAYERLSRAMLAGSLPPGARLVMDQLAEELDISRTPVRDALLRLEREGLIEPTGRRGYVVRAVSGEETAYLYEAREAIEGFAARRVAEIGPTATHRVAVAIDQSPAALGSDPLDVFDANMRVHRAIVQAAANPVLLGLFDDLWQRARAMAVFADYVGRGHPATSVSEDHLPLLDALRAGPDAAFAAMRDHIRQGQHSHLESEPG